MIGTECVECVVKPHFALIINRFRRGLGLGLGVRSEVDIAHVRSSSVAVRHVAAILSVCAVRHCDCLPSVKWSTFIQMWYAFESEKVPNGS